MLQELVILENLTKHFGTLTAVDNISLCVEKQQVLGFLGPNGAGKSTTMKMIAGFVEPTSGTARVAGYDIKKYPVQVKSRIGYLPEGAPSYGDMTPKSFLDFAAEIRGFDGMDKRRRIGKVEELVQLQEVMRQPIETLSKGFKRRVGLAQAMLHDPKVLILDEPTDGLDPNQKHDVRMLINRMSQEKAIIVSTHILEEVEAVCTDVVIIAGGKLLKKGTPEQLLALDKDHNSVVIKTKKKNSEKIMLELKALGAISQIENRPCKTNEVMLRLSVKKKANSLIQVNNLVRDKNLLVEEVYLAKGALDKVFRQITTLEVSEV